MILIVDSGSTKTDWIAIDKGGKVLFETQTLGLNPQVLTIHILKVRIVNNFELYKFRKEVEEIYEKFSDKIIKNLISVTDNGKNSEALKLINKIFSND